MGKRDRERKERIIAGREAPYAVSAAEMPLRPMRAGGRLMDDPLQSLRAATKEEAIRLAFDYARSKGQYPLVEEDDGSRVIVGLWSRGGVPGDAVELLQEEESEEWFCAEQRFSF